MNVVNLLLVKLFLTPLDTDEAPFLKNFDQLYFHLLNKGKGLYLFLSISSCSMFFCIFSKAAVTSWNF